MHTDARSQSSSPSRPEQVSEQPGPSDPRSATIVVPARFNGPPGSGNGGYVAGLLAARVAGEPAAGVTVTLRRPAPLDRSLTVDFGAEGGPLTLHQGEGPIAEAIAVDAASTLPTPIDPVTPDQAREASAAFAGFAAWNPYTDCFVCGPDRAEGDGLRLFPGMLEDRPDTDACLWIPHASLVAPDTEQIAGEFVWAALDCPGGWTGMDQDTALLLGRMTAHVYALPYPDEPCVVVGRRLGRDGRKVRTATTLYDAEGRVAAHAEQVWIAPRA
ncbi:hypothetical protein [Embleya sp. NBC_00896]|uniref:hypothetical protein n=1 Tax=Embleya sp. NBC_00896 TaxID=2975961 RepID=UPI0038705896|nr:hypothetical protein OG928_19880 [Embleya sp. NBC_00896]